MTPEQPIKLREATNTMLLASLEYMGNALGLLPAQLPTKDIVAITIEFMRSQFGDLTLVEFRQAVEWMTSGKLTNVESSLYGAHLSCAHVGKMLSAYKHHPERLQRIKAQSRENTKALPDIGEEQKENIIRESVLTAYDTYLASGSIIDYGGVAYNYLNRTGAINPTPERRWELYHHALDRLKTQARKDLKMEGDRLKRIDLKRFIDSESIEQQARMEAKRILLKEFFDLCKTENTSPL